ncbi:MAG: cellulase family glycosylhydrolase, partial [Lachnospiraceae bacterium]|nr:cellulase family glycosylhydrolase [Lachnospiraceae bacterium]
LGFDHVRVPVDYNVLEDEKGHRIESGFDYLRACREWCEAYGLHMLIDLHECYGYSFDPLKVDMDRKKFFYDAALQQRFLTLWEQIAEEFKDYPDQVAFEPLNEVVLMEVADAWNELAGRWIRMMRTIVPDSWLVIGGVCYNNVLSVPLLDLPMDEKVVYNFHCYEPMIFTHQGAYWVEQMPKDFRIGYPRTLEEYKEAGKQLNSDLGGAIYNEGISEIGEGFFEDIFAPALKKAEEDNAPLYCGEYGVIDLADNEDKIRWLTDIHNVFKRHGIGRALWNYKEKDFGMQDESFASIRDEFIRAL